MQTARSHARYNEWHGQVYGQLGEDTDDAPWHEMVKQHIGTLHGRKVLEIGCGRGGFSAWLAAAGADLVAADFSETAAAITAASNRPAPGWAPSFSVCVLDIQQLPFATGSFDLSVSLETLEHVQAPRAALGELVRVTKPGGRIIVTTPNYLSPLGVYRLYLKATGRRYTECGQPINNPLTLLERVRDLKRLGCDIEVIDGCGYYLYAPRRDPARIRWLDSPRCVTRWTAAHSLTIAVKPAPSGTRASSRAPHPR